MPSLKAIRTRIASVKSTQKITRAMKMVAGARLNRAQQRILALRPYAVKTHDVLAACTAATAQAEQEEEGSKKLIEAATEMTSGDNSTFGHPLLARRPEKSVLFVVLTSDRGLCGAFNASINRKAEHEWHEREQADQKVQFAFIGRKGRDYFRRRNAPVFHIFDRVWDELTFEKARIVAKTILKPFLDGEVDAIYLVYNEFKSAMTQRVVVEPLLPVSDTSSPDGKEREVHAHTLDDFLFEPDRDALLERLVPMYVEISLLRALLESNASEHGARMTAMDAATKNAKEMIANLTLQYNRARQAAITKELLEIISGAESLKG